MKISRVLLCSMGFLVDKKIASMLQTLTRHGKIFLKFEKSTRCGGLVQANQFLT